MAVEIELDLNAKSAEGKIGAIAASLKGLERVADDIDIDFDSDISNITGQIDKLSEALSSIDVDMSNLGSDLERAADKIPEEITVSANTPSGDTGSGDSTGSDPPDGGGDSGTDNPGGSSLSRDDLRSRLSMLYGRDMDSISVSSVDRDKLDEIASSLYHTTYQTGASNLGARAVPGSFHGEPENFEEMNWQDLQKMASEENAYTADATREELVRNLRSQRFSRSSDIGSRTYGLEGFMMDERRARELTPDEYRDVFDYEPGGFDLFDSDRSSSPITRFRESMPDPDSIDSKTIDEFRDSIDGFGSSLRKVRPTMGKYMQLLAALIPVAIALGVQLLGVASAMGAVAGAGGAIVGLGLLGHAETLTGSVQEAKQELRGLKMEMFETFQPAMQSFAPIQSEVFDRAPQMIQQSGLVNELQGLQSFDDTLFSLGDSLAGGMARAVEIINENDEAIQQLTERFAGLIGSGALEFFEWLIQEAEANQDMIVELGFALITLARVAYNLSMAVARFVTVLAPAFQLLAMLTGLLNNRAIMSFLTFVTVSYMVAAALSKLGIAALVALSRIGILGSGSFISSVVSGLASIQGYVAGLIAQYTALSGAAASAAAAMALTGIGALAVGAGAIAAGSMATNPGTFGSGSYDASGFGDRGGSTTVYNDNRSYEITQTGDDYASQKGMEDVVTEVSSREEAQTPPSINGSSETSN